MEYWIRESAVRIRDCKEAIFEGDRKVRLWGKRVRAMRPLDCIVHWLSRQNRTITQHFQMDKSPTEHKQ